MRAARFGELLLASLLGAALALAGAALWFARSDAPARRAAVATGGNASVASSDDVAALAEALAAEAVARETLESEVALMRAVLEHPAEAGAVGGAASLAAAAADAAPGGARLRAPGARPVGFDEDALRAAGFPADGVSELRERWEQTQLARLELADRATREGWVHKPRYRRQLQQLGTQLREQIGEDGYDQMLYALGRPNRVVVQRVIEGSAADAAGLRPGDRILRYDARRMHDMRDLRDATTQGRRGEPVLVDVDRAGERLSLRVARGPMGVLATVESEAPGS